MSYMPPTPNGYPTSTNQSQSSSNRTLWIILGSIGLVGVCSLLCIGVGVIGVLTMLGQQTSAVFSEIEGELSDGSQFELPSIEPVDVSAAIAIGTVKRVGDLEISVTDARIINGENGVEPEEYYQFLAVDLQIKNVGAQPVSLEEIGPWSWLQDPDDFTYDCCVFSLSDTAILSDDLAAGDVIEGTIVYEAPDDVETFFWIYEGSASGDLLIVRLEQLSAETDMATAPVAFRVASNQRIVKPSK